MAGCSSVAAGYAIHGTYAVEAGAYESIYINMPPSGLGKAGQLKPVSTGRETSRERMTTDKSDR